MLRSRKFWKSWRYWKVGHSMPTQPILRKVPGHCLSFAQNCTKCASMGTMKNPQVSDQNSKRITFYGLLNCKGPNTFLPPWITMLILKGFLEVHNFIVVQAISLKIDTPDISGLLFFNLQSELGYEIWVKSYKHLKTGLLLGREHICHTLTTCCEVPSWSRSKYSPDL